jgi:hypothetical protein
MLSRHSRPCRTHVSSLSPVCQLRDSQSSSLLQLPADSLTSLLDPLQSSAALSTTKPQLCSLHAPNRKHRFERYLCYCLRIRCRGNVFTEPLPSSERHPWHHCSGLRTSCQLLGSRKPCVIVNRINLDSFGFARFELVLNTECHLRPDIGSLLYNL